MTTQKIYFNWFVGTIRKAIWAPALLFFCQAVISVAFNGYVLYPWLDIPTHFIGGFAVAFFWFHAAENYERFVGSIHRPVRLLLVFSCVAMTAVAWEFYEFLSDYFLSTRMQHGVADTMSDLFFGLFGSGAYLAMNR